ncbi:S8 family serine peptidase [Deinococcus sp. 14RED07]|uniref:S8 family peptidase n=1 Tax=Deinococcus sp. 14RED07 TaxID=2745874 RepID=UPI001E3F220C|nr:S8 family serine peptidase [Deinococcus sp. 14RED07]MCD0175926.1 S8 family serine peptidase [Deinococcus sp. 14RED07]
MKIDTTVLSRLTLIAAALSLAACGQRTAPVQSALPAPAPLASGGQIATVRIGPDVTEAALRGALPGAQIIAFHADSGYALLSVPATLKAASLSSQGLRALGVNAQGVTLEVDQELEVMNEGTAEGLADGLGATTWAGGATAWAGGATTWAGGNTFLTPRDWASTQEYWAAINLQAAHRLVPELGRGVKVAVIDTGIDLNHPLLRGRIDTVGAWDYVGGDASPQEELPVSGVRKYGHGTAVSGVVLQVAPNAEILPLRVLNPNGRGPMSRVLQAMDRAVASGARVINLSLGSVTDSAALNTMISAALARGIVVVNSSGNSGKEGMVFPAQNLTTGLFTANSGLLGIGSVSLKGMKSSFSTYSAGMSLTAPGEKVITSYPDSRLAYASGTSFAAPAVSGAAALALSTGAASLSPANIAANLRLTATPSPDLLFKGKLGQGVLNVGAFVGRYR